MDNTEKHNTLERIRRKGLAKMLENLYAKTLDVEMPVTRLPAKHVVLKNVSRTLSCQGGECEKEMEQSVLFDVKIRLGLEC